MKLLYFKVICPKKLTYFVVFARCVVCHSMLCSVLKIGNENVSSSSFHNKFNDDSSKVSDPFVALSFSRSTLKMEVH